MTLSEFVNITAKKHLTVRPMIVCKDGFKISVQGSKAHYCTPQENSNSYLEMEVGYPSEVEPMLLDYAENPKFPEASVYGYVPFPLIKRIIEKHGGIDETKTFQPK